MSCEDCGAHNTAGAIDCLDACPASLLRAIRKLTEDVEWWREATEIKREQAKKLRALSARRGRELKEARAELKRLRAENEKATRFMAAFGAKP